ncbi:MAG TPA: zinc-ribbon domain containing protein [Dehalococcoidales bacterium]|nr:zinc-ribbon domain containing protein [Dehalococcoidales bacterium]
MALVEKSLRCRDCGQEFMFTVGEQEFYASHGLQNDPSRCPTCRMARRRTRSGGAEEGRPRKMHAVTCAECGSATQVPFEPSEGRPVFCRDCYSKQKRPI